jgi:hypothetical protein
MKEIKDFLPYYLNVADVIIDSVTDQFKTHFGHAPGHKTQLGPMLYAIVLEGHIVVKPILRKLNSMTEEELLKSANILGTCTHLSDYAKIAQAKELLTTNRLYNHQTNLPGIAWIRLTHYLTQQGIWLFGDEAFDNGLILEKKEN